MRLAASKASFPTLPIGQNVRPATEFPTERRRTDVLLESRNLHSHSFRGDPMWESKFTNATGAPVSDNTDMTTVIYSICTEVQRVILDIQITWIVRFLL